jgi:hypothetical protein
MSKRIVGNGNSSYAFNAAAKTVTFYGIDNLKIWQVLIIVNITRETIMYNPYVSGYGFTSFASNVLTLELDTSGYSNTDVLQIFYDNSDSQQANISDLAMEIKDLIRVIANPAFVDAVGGLKITSGVLTTLTTCTTVTTVTSVTTVGTVTTLNQSSGVPTTISINDQLLNISFQNVRNLIV